MRHGDTMHKTYSEDEIAVLGAWRGDEDVPLDGQGEHARVVEEVTR